MTELEKSFDRVADLYDRARPGYPESIFERILEFSGIDSSAWLLEVGAGTGKATLPFARRGFRILALEPGENLARVARSRLAEFERVEVQTTSFEDWQPADGSFDLAFVAQAFHWLAPEQRLAKFAAVLRPSGTLAAFGNSFTIAKGKLSEALQALYARVAPTLRSRDLASSWYSSTYSPVLSELQSSPLFSDASFESFSWEWSLNTPEYCELLGTYSDHSTLPSVQFQELSNGVAAALDEHGGRISLEYKTGLFLARAIGQ